MQGVALTKKELETSDAILLTTAHSTLDYALLNEFKDKLVDTRNAVSKHASQAARELVLA